MKKIGVIGFGNMGSAICERLKSEYEVLVFDKDRDKTKKILDLKVSKNNRDLVINSDIIVLAIKPQDFDLVLKEIKDFVKKKLIISVAAGITTNYIEKFLGKIRVIRCMPNLPLVVSKGMSCLCKGKFATEEDLNFTKIIFGKMGETLILNEDMMDKATAVSGSGPGYYYNLIQIKKIDYRKRDELKRFEEDYFIPQLTISAERIGFNLKQAKILAKKTAEGSRILLQFSQTSPKELFKKIASKGGTTQAASEVLHRGGCLEEAVKVALRRAKELSKK